MHFEFAADLGNYYSFFFPVQTVKSNWPNVKLYPYIHTVMIIIASPYPVTPMTPASQSPC